MNRRLLVFFILVNALVSLTIAVTVVWIAEQRRPRPEELIVPATPAPAVVLIATPTAGDAQTAQESDSSPSATPTADAASPAPGEMEIYTVKAGDSLSTIAERFGVSSNRLLEINNLTDPNLVYIGQRLTYSRLSAAGWRVRGRRGRSAATGPAAAHRKCRRSGDGVGAGRER